MQRCQTELNQTKPNQTKPPSLGPLLESCSTPIETDAGKQAPTCVSQCLPILQGVKTPSPAIPQLLSIPRGQFNSNDVRQAPDHHGPGGDGSGET